jgi:mannose/fructose/N-acetylgalactosamine-specific phosphotransferase system component IID
VNTRARATTRWWPAAVLVAGIAVAAGLALGGLAPGLSAGGSGSRAPVSTDRVDGILPAGVSCFLLVLWTMIVAADERALGPLVLREPLVAAGVAGTLLGAPLAGWLMGLVLQSIWPGLQPMGGSRQPWAGPGSVVGVLWVGLLPNAVGAWRLPAALAAALAAAWVGMVAEDLLRARNDRREAAWVAAPARLRGELLSAQIHRGVLESGLAGLIVLAMLVIVPLAVFRGLAGAIPREEPLGWAASGPLFLAAAAVVSLLALGGVLGRTARAWASREAEAAGGPAAEPRELAGPRPTPLDARRMWALITLQAGFGNRYMQRSGFLYFLFPGSGPTRGAAGQLEEDILAGGPLNTQPIMAAALLGATERVLAEARDQSPPRPIVRLLDVGGPLLAQWGDHAIWGALRPALALLALAGAASWPGAAMGYVGYALVGLALSLGARARLYRWGWTAGWDVVRGWGNRVWRRSPDVASRALAPLAVLAAASVLGTFALGIHRVGGGSTLILFSLGAASFILGVPLGAVLGQRPLAWAWICGAAAASVVALGRLMGGS